MSETTEPDTTEPETSEPETTAPDATAGDTNKPTIALLVKFKSRLPLEELRRRYHERMPQVRAMSGIVQKYYVHDEASGEVGGLYLWDSEESLQAYLASDLRKTIGSAYEVEGTPTVQRLSVLDILR